MNAALTEAAIALEYGSARAMMPSTPNQKRWRRVPRLLRPRVPIVPDRWETTAYAGAPCLNHAHLCPTPRPRMEVMQAPYSPTDLTSISCQTCWPAAPNGPENLPPV